jgi:multidrug resistance efflux pump
MLVAATALGAALLALYVWQLPPFRSSLETTENAYVRGSVTVIAPKVDGYVADVAVQDFMAVSAGQVLVQLDDRIHARKLDQARANLDIQLIHLANLAQNRRAREAALASSEAQLAGTRAQLVNARAQLVRAQADMRRADALVASDSLSQRERDQTLAALRQAEAAVEQGEAGSRQAQAGQRAAGEDLRAVEVNKGALEAAVAAARAAVHLAEIDLDNTRIRAPRDGHVGEIGVKLGQYVTPGTQLMALVPRQLWIIANYKEAQTAAMAPGQSARFRVDALGDAELSGHVERLSPATGSEFSAIKPDTASGNFTKIPQRIPVRIAVDREQPLAAQLRPGMSVVVRVDTASRGDARRTTP